MKEPVDFDAAADEFLSEALSPPYPSSTLLEKVRNQAPIAAIAREHRMTIDQCERNILTAEQEAALRIARIKSAQDRLQQAYERKSEELKRELDEATVRKAAAVSQNSRVMAAAEAALAELFRSNNKSRSAAVDPADADSVITHRHFGFGAGE